jgi:DNA-binding CsgD family transcriptional regulator
VQVAALADAGRPEDALAVAARHARLAEERGAYGMQAPILVAAARALPTAEAVAALEHAVAVARRCPMRRVLAHALAALGAAQRRAGRRSDARDTLREARDLAHRVGAAGLEAQILEELVVAGGRPQRIALDGVDALTPSERRVAELAATGLRNKEIAETLFVTLKTVEVHLGRAYGKLGIQGRSQLAAALAAS